MSDFAVVRDSVADLTASGSSTWAKDYLRSVALADFGCAIVGVFAAAQLRFGNHVTGAYIALSLALPGALAR